MEGQYLSQQIDLGGVFGGFYDSSRDGHEVPAYPTVNHPRFAELLSLKMEFRELWSQHLYKHQELVRRYASPLTPYDRLLVLHSTGTGKTFICCAVVDDHYEHSGRRCLVLVKGDTGRQGYMRQVHDWARRTRGEYCDVNDYVRKRYEVRHLISFCNRVRSTLDKKTIERYNNTVIIIDEAHCIGPSSEGDDTNYNVILRFVTSIRSSKVLLLTATPMTDTTEKMYLLANLLLPEDKRTNHDVLKDPQRLGKLLMGHVSFHTDKINVAQSETQGEAMAGVKHKVVKSMMEGAQLRHYLVQMHDGTRNDISRSITHASLFCFGDGTFGRRLHDKMHTETVERRIVPHGCTRERTLRYKVYRISEPYVSEVSRTMLPSRSCKYHTIVESLESSEGLSFVFIEEVQGSGLMLFSAILLERGYDLYVGESYEGLSKGKRFTLCVGDKKICPNPTERIAGFNNRSNASGDYVKVMVGSRVIGQSITLLNVRTFHCAIPHWNDSTIEQAIGRVIRTKAHDDLEESKRNVTINIHVAVADSPGASREHNERSPSREPHCIDVKKMLRSHEKYTSIAAVEEALRHVSIESIMSREAQPRSWDATTFCKYYVWMYMHEYTKMVSTCISRHIMCNARTHVEHIIASLSMPRQLVLEVLCYIMVHNVPVHIRGTTLYIREVCGTLTLTTDITADMVTYRHPATLYTTYQRSVAMVIPSVNMRDVRGVMKACVDAPFERCLQMISNLRWVERLRLLETCIEEHHELLEIYKYSIVELDGSIYHVYEYRKPTKGSYKTSARGIPSSGLTRKYDGLWSYAPLSEERRVLEIYEAGIDAMESRAGEVGVYAIQSTIDLKIRMRDMGMDREDASDMRTVHRGRDIATLEREALERYLGLIQQYDPLPSHDLHINLSHHDTIHHYSNTSHNRTDHYTSTSRLHKLLVQRLRRACLVVYI